MAEIVTREMVLAATRAACDRSSVWKGATDAAVMGVFGANMQAALFAVAPLIRRAALVEAAACIEKKHTNNFGRVHPMAASDAAAILALAEKQP